MKFKALAAVSALAVLALPAVGDAQVNKQTSNQPIAFGADSGEQTTATIALRGRAELTQGGNRLRADAIEGASSASGQISSVTASGNVYYVTPTETIRGDRAVYTISNATIVITGDVILTQGKNVMTGGRLTYNVDTGTANMAAGSNSRIQGVFYPQGAN